MLIVAGEATATRRRTGWILPASGSTHRTVSLCAFLLLQACAQEEPEYVYVPADDYVIAVEIALPAEARAGEWTRLTAQRRSGPWKRIRREEAPAGFVPFVRPPPEFESEVADNLFWMTEPPGARFDVPAMQPHHRFVFFPKPGTYQVWARSAYPTDAKSNVVTIRVR